VVVLLLLLGSIRGKVVAGVVTISSELAVVEGADVVTSVVGALPAFRDTVSMTTPLSVSGAMGEAVVAAESREGTATSTDGPSAEGGNEEEAEAEVDEAKRGSLLSGAILAVDGTTRFFLSLAPNVSLSLLAAS